MGIHEPLPWPAIGPVSMPAVSRILARYDREKVEAFISIAVDLLDVFDGDPDLEETGAEDSFVSHPANGPGCAVSDDGGGAADDAGEPDDDAGGDTSWTEWHTRGRLKDNPGLWMKDGRQCLEDHEDDDADTCLTADDQGAKGGRWFDTDGKPGDLEDAEDGHDREQCYEGM